MIHVPAFRIASLIIKNSSPFPVSLLSLISLSLSLSLSLSPSAPKIETKQISWPSSPAGSKMSLCVCRHPKRIIRECQRDP